MLKLVIRFYILPSILNQDDIVTKKQYDSAYKGGLKKSESNDKAQKILLNTLSNESISVYLC